MLLITGGAGFIGYHLSQHLSQKFPIVSIDNFSTYYSTELKRLRAKLLKLNENIVFKELDINDRIGLNRLFDEYDIEVVINLAAQPGVRLPVNSYWKYVNANLSGFETLMECAITNDVYNLIFASSSSVYGDSQSIPLTEGQSVLTPKSYYGVTKLCNELTARIYSTRHQLKSYGLRFFTVYGPWGRPDMAYFRIASALANNESFNVFGDGSVIRDFTYIDDVTESIDRLLEKLLRSNSPVYEILNVGGGKPSSLNELINEFENQSGKRLSIVYKASNVNDVKATDADWNKLIEFSGFRPRIGLEEGVSRILEWAHNIEVLPYLSGWVKSVE